ncbi:MAG: transposase [Clostridiales bacterium]|nr:transposase [Clostridiales bacterium]
MSRKSKFTREEKVAAVNLVLEGRTPRSVANEYGVHENTIYKWKMQLEMDPESAFTEQAEQAGVDEVSRLKRRVKELELELEFLKKAAAYFAKNPR